MKKSVSIRDFLTTTGRFPRSVYWAFMGSMYGLFIILGFISESAELSESTQIVSGIAIFPLLIVAIIVQIKRWHDLDKSAWWIFINFIPCIGGLWALIECGFIKGTLGPNSFGEDPLRNIPVPPPFPPK